jgi:hypothetical protein
MRLSQKCVNLRGEVVQERVVLEHDLEGLMLGPKKQFSKDGLILLDGCRLAESTGYVESVSPNLTVRTRCT